jgi:protease-4
MSDNMPNTPPSHPPIPPQSPPPRPHPTAGYHAPPPYPQQPPHYQQPPARSGGCSRFFLYGFITLIVLGMVGVGILLGSFLLLAVATNGVDVLAAEAWEKMLTEKTFAGNRSASNKIAVITIEGIITSNSDGYIARQIRQVKGDTDVKAIVLRVDSPGGTMSGSDYYHHLLQQMKSKLNVPVVVSMGSTAASGGYYVSMIGDEIYAEPSTITGSIGVIASLFDASELLKNVGVTMNPIVSGPHKTMGSFTKPMTEEERALWQRLIDDNFDRFKEIIREGRKRFANKPEELDKLATGQVFTANDAVDNGLIDEIGFIDDAIERAGKMAGMADRDYKVIQYKPKRTVMETLLESRAPNMPVNGKTLSEMTTPRIYLLCPQVIPILETE